MKRCGTCLSTRGLALRHNRGCFVVVLQSTFLAYRIVTPEFHRVGCAFRPTRALLPALDWNVAPQIEKKISNETFNGNSIDFSEYV